MHCTHCIIDSTVMLSYVCTVVFANNCVLKKMTPIYSWLAAMCMLILTIINVNNPLYIYVYT